MKQTWVTLNLQRICRTRKKLFARLTWQIRLKHKYMWVTGPDQETDCRRGRHQWRCWHCVCVCVCVCLVKARHMAIISISGRGSNHPAERNWQTLHLNREKEFLLFTSPFDLTLAYSPPLAYLLRSFFIVTFFSCSFPPVSTLLSILSVIHNIEYCNSCHMVIFTINCVTATSTMLLSVKHVFDPPQLWLFFLSPS